MKIGIPVIVYSGLIIACIIVIPPISPSFASSSSSSLTIDGITCDKAEHFVSHIHTHLNIFINGKKVDFKTDYKQIPLNEHDEIAIIYGKPPNSIPSNYEFPEGL
jgi:hypothetical protein